MDVEGEILNTTMDVEGGIPATSDTHASYASYDTTIPNRLHVTDLRRRKGAAGRRWDQRELTLIPVTVHHDVRPGIEGQWGTCSCLSQCTTM